MLGRFLKSHGWHKKPVTHAAILWVLVAFALLMLLVFGTYSRRLAEIRMGAVQAKSLRMRVQRSLPSVFGTVTAFDGGTIEVESRQPFERIIVDDVTDVSRVGGGTFNLARLKPGMTVMATGHEDGTTLVADALVILTEEDLDTDSE